MSSNKQDRVLTDEQFNSLEWQLVSYDKLSEMMQGLVIVCVDIMGAPLLDGVIIYGENSQGDILLFDLCSKEDLESSPPYYFSLSKVRL